jgi:hypothetical protein
MRRLVFAKMALMWRSNLACRSPHYYATEDYLDILRRNALGNYKTMVTEIAHSMCMLEFLSNQLNRKGNPNENFGRELLELFTLEEGITPNRILKKLREPLQAGALIRHLLNLNLKQIGTMTVPKPF